VGWLLDMPPLELHNPQKVGRMRWEGTLGHQCQKELPISQSASFNVSVLCADLIGLVKRLHSSPESFESLVLAIVFLYF